MKEEDYNILEDEELDLLGLFKRIWKGRKLVFIITGACMALGLFIAIFSPVSYTSSYKFAPQATSTSTSSRYSSLASLVGIDLSSATYSGALSPKVYPQILDNFDFQKELMYSKLHFDGYSEPIAIIDYLNDPQYHKFNLLTAIRQYTIGLPGLIANGLKKKADASGAGNSGSSSSLKMFSEKEENAAIALKHSLDMDLNSKDGYIVLSAKMPEAVASTELCENAYGLLKKFVADLKVEKAKTSLDFIEGQYNEAKADYEKKQRAYAYYMDSHQGISTASANVERTRLASEADLSRQLFTELANELMSARVRLEENTVAFADLAPASVPSKRSTPKRKQILAIWTLIGLFAGCISAAIVESVKEKKEEE